MKFAVVILSLLAYSARANAEAASSARAHYQAATAHFAIGEFDDAAKEYELAYKLKQDPALLFDAAQSHRLAGHHQKALLLYRNYLQLYPKGENLGAVREQIVKLNQAIAADETVKSSPPTGTAEPSTQMSEKGAPVELHPVPTPPPPLVTSTPVLVAKPPEKRHSRAWIWGVVGGGCAVGLAVGLGVGLTVGRSSETALNGLQYP